MELTSLRETIEAAWEDRSRLGLPETQEAIREVVEHLDKGRLRTAEPAGDGSWRVNEWVKKAVILYFPIQKMRKMGCGDIEFFDKMETKQDFESLGVRVVPNGVARYGSYLAPGVIMMPSYVNIGAYVDEGTMVDTWATVGSCAQVGKGVHLSGGVG
ncbi:MAG: 2,3,4,5-tetrahydropyridine-2,6-dicarboxylate N-succinyltransferase, partial [Rikenella sp.]|nr:2,3,4,5-tetrahydropyridine-2,6-dicarboxylate N-succinyltransferase [Rikenella sp.]